MTPHEILIAARAKIDTPQKWCRDALAKDRLGKPCAPESKSAVQYCFIGAIQSLGRVLPRSRVPAYEILNSVCIIPIEHFNDRSEHADVMAAYDKAIEMTKGESE